MPCGGVGFRAFRLPSLSGGWGLWPSCFSHEELQTSVLAAVACTSIGLGGTCSLTGKTGLSGKKTAIWHLEASVLLGSLCAWKGFQQNAFSLMESQCFWMKAAAFGKHASVETLAY